MTTDIDELEQRAIRDYCVAVYRYNCFASVLSIEHCAASYELAGAVGQMWRTFPNSKRSVVKYAWTIIVRNQVRRGETPVNWC
jgi:hypothetical protein